MRTLRSIARRARIGALLVVPTLLAFTACGSDVAVDYGSAGAGADGALTVYVGAGGDREILTHVASELLPDTVHLTLVDAPDDANARIADGDGDLAFFQHAPAFTADAEQRGLREVSIASSVNVLPYGLYSSRWRNLDETRDWVNNSLVGDQVTGESLPHGARVALPSTPTGFARGLYLLQTRNLVTLDRPFGGTTTADLTVGQANVLDSPRHLSVLGLELGEFLRDVYTNYDAVVLTPKQADSLGLVPDRDALALEPGPGNPYAHVLVAPSRLAGDPRVQELTHALTSPELARFLAEKYHGANISANGDKS